MNEISIRETEALQDLIQRSNLDGIQFHELSAKITDDAESTLSEAAEVRLQYQTRASETDFGVRVSVDVESESGTAKVVVAAEYQLENGTIPEANLLDLFATEVAIMTLFPFVREGIHSITGRVFGVPMQLPILERGQISRNLSQDT